MNYLITGAQFSNKGAQSLLFTAVNEIKKHDYSATIYYVPIDKRREDCFDKAEEYAFAFVYDDQDIFDAPANKSLLSYGNRLRYLLKKKKQLSKQKNVYLLSRIWPQIDVLFDVSGYQLSSNFPISDSKRNIRYFNKAKRMSIPVVLLPQSYGPFEYNRNRERLLKELRICLSKVNLIFAREEEGKKQLSEILGIQNVILSTDIVLQGDEINLEAIYKVKPDFNYPILKTRNNVGIIPNKQTIRFGDESELLDCYRTVIQELLDKGKEIYIFRHSDDLELCKKIYSLFQNEGRCHLIETDMNCFVYSMFVRQFDYIIASRYHAIVHAYRENVPSIIIGWAFKYQELARYLHQENYVFDITGKVDINALLQAVDQIENNLEKEKLIIAESMQRIKRSSCFEQCWRIYSQKHDH